MTKVNARMKIILSLLVISMVIAFPTIQTANATACNLLPPWGIGIGLCDIVGCCDIVSILNVFNFFNLVNILGVVFNGCSCINYSVECGWNFLSYCIWPCTLVNCGNVINLFSGRVVICNLINIMSGIFNFGNIFNILSGSCVNLMNGVTIGGSLYPPCIASGGLLNIGTGCNPCNPCLPACVNTGLTDFMNVLFLPLTIILAIITALITPFITLWGSVFGPNIMGMTYQQMGSAVMGALKDPLPACGGIVTKGIGLVGESGLKDLCFSCVGIVWGLLKKIVSMIMGMCGKTGILDSLDIMGWLSGTMEKFLPMKISLAGK